MVAKLPDSDEEVTFFVYANQNAKNIPQEELTKILQNDMKEVRVEKPMQINTFHSQYSFVDIDDDFIKKYGPGQIVVEAHLPYCLHLPEILDLKIKRDNSSEIRVFHKKIWTDRAKESLSIDILCENKVTFYNKGTILSPKFPIKEEEGWEQYFTGKNVEKVSDQNGTFRYTKVMILIPNTYSKEEIENGSEKLLNKISDEALSAINNLLDVYKYVTKSDYIERLGYLSVNNYYFVDFNIGYYPCSAGFGIQSAVMNRSHEEIKRIGSMLALGEKPPLHELLMLNASFSLKKNALTLAVVESFQALEVFLEHYLFTKYKTHNLSEKEVNTILRKKWNIKTRLKECLLELTGFKISSRWPLWEAWCTAYDKVRNEVIHRGKTPSQKEAENILKMNVELVETVSNLQLLGTIQTKKESWLYRLLRNIANR